MTRRQVDSLIRILGPTADADCRAMTDEHIYTLCKFLNRCVATIEELRDAGKVQIAQVVACAKADKLLDEWSGNNNDSDTKGTP